MEVKAALALFLLHGVAISTVLARKTRTPTIRRYPDSYSVTAGVSVTLICLTDPHEVTTSYRWYKGSNRIGNSNVLFKRNVSRSDSGGYKCQAKTGKLDWSSFSERTLKVEAPPKKPVIMDGANVVLSSKTINIGETLTLICSKNAAGEVPTDWEWYKQPAGNAGNKVTSGVTGATLGITVTADDAGVYYCEALKDGLASPLSEILTLKVNDTETWKTTCSSLWTPWATENLTSNLEHRSQSCGEISSEGGIRNWSLKKENRTRQVSDIAASFRSTKTFTKKLLEKTTQEYKDMKEHFEPLLQNAFRSKVASGQMKGVNITGFEEGSVIVHYTIILKGSVNITDTSVNPAAVSTILVNYLKENPNEAKKYDIAPGSAGTDGGTQDFQASSQKSLQNKIDVISAITATLIVILIVTVVVLVVFLIRLKRQVMAKQSSGDGVEYTTGVNGNGQAGVKVKKSNGLYADNTYAAIGEKEPVIINDLYQSLGEQKSIVKPQVSMVSRENPAFETEEADYVNIVKAVISTVEGSAGVDGVCYT